jgi:hypothetical protein
LPVGGSQDPPKDGKLRKTAPSIEDTKHIDG